MKTFVAVVVTALAGVAFGFGWAAMGYEAKGWAYYALVALIGGVAWRATKDVYDVLTKPRRQAPTPGVAPVIIIAEFTETAINYDRQGRPESN